MGNKLPPITPLIEAHYDIEIHKGVLHDEYYYWTAHAREDIGIGRYWFCQDAGTVYGTRSPKEAIEHWERFAQTNFISSYTIVRNRYIDDILEKEIQYKV